MTSARRRYVRLSTTSCPSCGEKGGLKKIMYGMPGEDFEFERYIVGGCIVTDEDPEIGCVKCDWRGVRGECSQ